MRKNRTIQLLKENGGFLLAMLLLFACRSSLADWYHVPSGSMQPTIVEGDRIWVNKIAYRLEVPFTNIELATFATPKRGDIIVFDSAAADNRLVKRVIGLPGDMVAMQDNQLFINGHIITQSGITDSQVDFNEQLDNLSHQIRRLPVDSARDSFNSVQVPEGHYLVLGDNRNNSMDSRYYGFVPFAEIQGKATKVAFSLDPDDYYTPRSNRFFEDLI